MHVNKTNNKKYIGVTSQDDVEKRWMSGHGYRMQYFSRAINKYGWDGFEHIVIADNLTEDEAYQMETELIFKYDTTNNTKGYNVSIGGKNPSQSEEGRRKISEFHKGNKYNLGKKHSEETKKRWSEKRKGVRCSEDSKKKADLTRRKKSIKILCENNKFDYIWECSQYYNVEHGTVRDWLSGKNPMPKDWYDKGLRYENKTMEDYKIQKGVLIGENNPVSKKVVCEDKLFYSISECRDYYNIPHQTLSSWLTNTIKMPKDWYDKGLRFYDKEMSDYTMGTHLCIIKVVCENIVYDSISQCARYYDVNNKTMMYWLKKDKIPKHWIGLGLAYYNEEIHKNYLKFKEGDKIEYKSANRTSTKMVDESMFDFSD